MPHPMEEKCDCEDVMDAKVESLKEYLDDKMHENNDWLLSRMLHFDDTVIQGVHTYVERYTKERIKKLLLYILPPIVFLLILGMIL